MRFVAERRFVDCITPMRWYSPTRRSKKFVLPSSEMCSMKSNGFPTLKIYSSCFSMLNPAESLISKHFNNIFQTNLRAVQLEQKAICHVLDVLAHERNVHSNQSYRQRLSPKEFLDGNGIADYFLHTLHWWLRKRIYTLIIKSTNQNSYTEYEPCA